MPTLLSVDIWDTLLRRRCHPDEVKLFTARALWAMHRPRLLPRFANAWQLLDERVRCEAEIAREREAAGLDNEYAVEEVFGRWLARTLNPSAPRSRHAAIAERLVEIEVGQEMRVVYPDRRMARLLGHHGADRLVGLSDFYLGERHLRRIIEHACGRSPFERVFVSADCLVNKMRGRLFAHAQREIGAEPMHHTHIGDNEWSDVQSPKRFGVRGVHYLNPEEEPARAAHRARFEARRRGSFVATAQALTALLEGGCRPPAGLDPGQRRLFEIGYRTAPVYVALVLGAMGEAHELGCPAVHYCTREGEFFLRVHRAIEGERPFGPPPPRGELLEVSRVCSFLPSLREVSTREMMRVWGLYSRQSLGQLLRTLDLPAFPFEPLLARHGVDADETVAHPWKDRRVQRLFADPLFIRLVEQQRDRRREVTLEYLRGKGLGAGPAVMVDIGWRGTIQDNIAHLFPGRHIAGWYLGLVRFLNEQPANAVKRAIGPDARTDPELVLQIIYNCSPLEMLANTDSGSVRRYERGAGGSDGAAGSVVAVRTHDEGEDAVWRRYTRYFQEGVLAAAPVVAGWARTFAVEPAEMKPMVLDLLRNIKASPARVLAEAFFSLRHNETFGVGGFVEKRPEISQELLRRGEESGGSDPEFVRAVEASDWPQGLLRLLGHEELCRQYNAFREDRARRIDQRLAAQRAAAEAGPVVEVVGVVAQAGAPNGRAHQPGHAPGAQR
ncbi:MAG: HAD family hydrolase [Phycisphaerales bacterium]|nr:HAD family hydrolase [Phycisphaerales bacterium]